MKRISIITPCRNAETYVGETIASVLSQTALLSGRAELEYIICDGRSNDRTVEIAESLAADFRHGSVRVLSRRDTGMYDALAHGLSLASGDVCAYINAGDYYARQAFDVVLDLLETKAVRWLTGISAVYNDRSQLVEFYLPFKYRRRLFECGAYGRIMATVQQESTFWDAELNRCVDPERLAKFRYAGDFYLWHAFAQHAELKVVSAYLGGFRRHRGQISEDSSCYLGEMDEIVGARRVAPVDYFLGHFDNIMWKLPPAVKKFFNRNGLYRYDHELQAWV